MPIGVIPGRREAASPESMTTDRGYGFRAPSLRSGPGMTERSVRVTILEIDVAAPSHPRHFGPAAIQIRPDSTPRLRGRIPLGANLLRALDAMIHRRQIARAVAPLWARSSFRGNELRRTSLFFKA